MRAVLILFAFSFVFVHFKAIAQESELEKIEKLNLLIQERDSRRIERAKRNLLTAFESIKTSNQAEDESFLRRVNDEIASATNTFFEVYKSYCAQFWNTNRRPVAPEVERAREFERRATGHFEQATFLRQLTAKKSKYEEIFYIFNMATELEMLGLLNLARAIRVYQDFPVIYAYEWEDDVEVPRESPERVARVITLTDQTLENLNKDQTEDMVKLTEIVFIVQIAAHTIPMQESYLRTIYKGHQEIKMVHEDRWYKYFLGPYKNLNDAQRVLSVVGVKNAFIAAYEDEKRINVREAIERLSNR